VAQPPSKQHRKGSDDHSNVNRDGVFHKSILPVNLGPVRSRPVSLRLWQKPMNEQRVKSNHRQGKEYDYIIHSLVFLSAHEIGVAPRMSLGRICVSLSKNCLTANSALGQ